MSPVAVDVAAPSNPSTTTPSVTTDATSDDAQFAQQLDALTTQNDPSGPISSGAPPDGGASEEMGPEGSFWVVRASSC